MIIIHFRFLTETKMNLAVAVVGTRYLELTESNYRLIESGILDWERSLGLKFSTVVSGGANGVDTLAYRFALQHDLEMVEFKPEYDKYPPRVAPVVRNSQIVARANYLIAFPKGASTGTRDSIRKATKAGLPVKVHEL